MNFKFLRGPLVQSPLYETLAYEYTHLILSQNIIINICLDWIVLNRMHCQKLMAMILNFLDQVVLKYVL